MTDICLGSRVRYCHNGKDMGLPQLEKGEIGVIEDVQPGRGAITQFEARFSHGRVTVLESEIVLVAALLAAEPDADFNPYLM